ncbi:MAG: hypothetical protein COT74_10300 [Bdellovibrionales bacterium CG10_big_fil_rev_8_21_14_0_10_45_34]|nr:MAG: hypothetical protein COT74_10300 [Bdellovibrionales bacterium CG10_big_fil_rev_8_21_14_0_10_45_34]
MSRFEFLIIAAAVFALSSCQKVDEKQIKAEEEIVFASSCEDSYVPNKLRKAQSDGILIPLNYLPNGRHAFQFVDIVISAPLSGESSHVSIQGEVTQRKSRLPQCGMSGKSFKAEKKKEWSIKVPKSIEVVNDTIAVTESYTLKFVSNEERVGLKVESVNKSNAQQIFQDQITTVHRERVALSSSSFNDTYTIEVKSPDGLTSASVQFQSVEAGAL